MLSCLYYLSRLFRTTLAALTVFSAAFLFSGEPVEPAPTAPTAAAAAAVTTSGGEAGDLLKKWFAEGTAAGNIGDTYDNRDREHSGLRMATFPQLQKITYSKEELDKRADWAFFSGVRSGIVFGNSSTSAGAYEGGSNPRQGYAKPKGLKILYTQYTSNNLYIYPEHRDHDAGHNGAGDGYGDLYPANTPFLLISQGSSGSDQPFMRAVPMTLAAFRPEVKKVLAQKGMLMAAVQMILRYTNKILTEPDKEYLTGKAHPTVFEGSGVRDAAMIKLAHSMTTENLPPLVALKVIEEDQPQDGLDFFEPGATEVHATNAALIARIFRGRQNARRLVVSAEDSVDLNKRPLKFHWSILRGDAARITITPKNEAGSVVEIKIRHHDRAPISAGSAMESNRVDIGAFVHNGSYFSAPAFVTYFFLDQEARAYHEDGRILEIGYKSGETTLAVPDWQKLLALFEGDAPAWPVRFLREQFKPAEVEALAAAKRDYAPLVAAAASAEDARKQAQSATDKATAAFKDADKKEQAARTETAPNPALEESTRMKKEADAERKKAEQALKEAQKKLEAAKKAVENFLREKREGLSEPIQRTVESVLQKWLKQPDFLCAHKSDITALLQTLEGKARVGALKSARLKLAALGLVKSGDDIPGELTLIAPPRATRFEQAMLERCNGELLAHVFFPGVVTAPFKVNYVQPELAEPPEWRDVYRYAADGTPQGWIRYGAGEPQEFNADGLSVLKKDERGRCVTARTVTYQPEKLTPEEFKKRGWPQWRKTIQSPGSELKTYSYENEKDLKGKVVKTEAAQ